MNQHTKTCAMHYGQWRCTCGAELAEPQHTPGPWKAYGVMVKDTPDTLGGMARIEMPQGEFAFCTNHADAALIAAVPDLLEALKLLTQAIDLGTLNIRKDFHLINAHACATKAIAKAERKP
jgi:hypothetical protein